MATPISSARPMGSFSRLLPSDDHGSSDSSRDRPLPTSRSRSKTVTERPRTSSGPESRKLRGRTDTNQHFKSRDDTFVADMVAKGTTQKSYHMPIRGKAPSPDSSPDSRSHSPPTTTVVRTTTPDSMNETEDTGLVTIGMALGSPSHAPGPVNPTWRPQQITRAMTASAAVSQPEPQAPREETPVKGKSRKWGIFGRSKSTKRNRSATTSAGSPPSATQEQFGATPPPQASFMRQDSPQVIASPVRNKPAVVRSQTAPLIGDVPSSRKVNAAPSTYKTTQMARKPLPNQPAFEPRRPAPPVKAHSDVPKPQLLNVDIPSVEMERYSVMFGSVLQPNRGSSSLLARRQATLEKLRTLKDETERDEEGLAPLKPPPRRATSPHTGRQSPSFSLFPPTPGKSGTPQTPRARSNTSPAFLPSPSQPNFSPQEAEIFLQRSASPTTRTPRQKQRAQGVSTPNSAERESSRERAKLHKPRSSSKLRNPQLVVDSPTSIAEEPAGTPYESKPLPALQEDEPKWQMVSKTSLGSSVSVATPDASNSVRSQSSTPTAAQEAKKKADDEAQKALRDAVETSIRRQISMSQQQRQMLRPQHINASPLAPASSPSSSRKDASPQGVGIAKNVVPRVVVGKNERLAETKSSTPTLVHPESGGQSPLTNRKSERIVLESA